MEHVSNIQRDTVEDVFIEPNSKNFDDDGFVAVWIDLFGNNFRDKFPNDFDAWNVKKQSSWIKQNLAIFFPNVPHTILSFISAAYCQLDFYRSPEELPEWMNMDKYRRGQKFVQNHYFSIIMAKFMGLICIFSFKEGLSAFLLGEHSHTPYLGFKKYISTIIRMSNWYKGDPWVKGTKAYKDMQVTCRMHLAVRKKVCQMEHEQITSACTFANPWSLDRELLLKDFASAGLPEKFEPDKFVSKLPCKPKGINNSDFAIAQGAFVTLPLLYSQSIGIYNATDEDLEAFCHMWKCFGYFLGLEDEYNFCRGSLEEIKQRGRDLQYWIKEHFKELTPEWEHTSRCIRFKHASFIRIT
ncbi:uncharacterized protein LOC118647631 isoform X2 [Monomorium pharaonis]|uniref:uncharacterized protein LOC118647631 isoform X2 n=1 Tax=Monomorium pharaonis TaxID=307658 RepID=UPI0017470313|nr:uncharacterized protein LOC118647631 isoform X2 [Monomorium pharaonis]